MASSSSHADFNYGVRSGPGTEHPTDSETKWHYVITFETHIAHVESETARQSLAEKSIVPLRAEWICTVYRQETHAKKPYTTIKGRINSSLEEFCQSYLEENRKWPYDELSLSHLYQGAQDALRSSLAWWRKKDVEVSVVKPERYIRMKQDRGTDGCRWKAITLQDDPRVGLPDVRRCQNLCQGQSEEMCIQILEMGQSTYKTQHPQLARKAKTSGTRGTQASHRAIAPKPAGYNSNTNPQEYTADTPVMLYGENTGETYYDPDTGTSYQPSDYRQ